MTDPGMTTRPRHVECKVDLADFNVAVEGAVWWLGGDALLSVLMTAALILINAARGVPA